MRTWQRTSSATVCGRCTETIPAGDKVLVITASTWRKVRCRNCAGEIPPELPPSPERIGPELVGMTPISRLAKAQRFDWKSAQAGEREPGMEG